MLSGQADFRRLALRRPKLFSVTLDWRDHIRFQICAANVPFYDYHDPASVGPLLSPVPADGLVDGIKRWLKINLDLDKMYKLTRLRARVRQLVKGKWLKED